MFNDTDTYKNIQKAAGVALIIIAVGLIGWYIVRDFSLINSQEKVEETTTEGEGLDVLVENGDVDIQEIPVDLDINADELVRPKLGRTIEMPDRFSPEAATILRNNIATLTTQLEKDPNSFQAWSDLAIQYKIIDDFEGAAEIWEFLSIAAEGNTDSRVNLGNLYHFQLKNYERSESTFKDIISINNGIVEAYVGLYELYRYSYKTDTTLAVDILKEGIIAIPNNIDIRMLLASYYTDLEMNIEAKVVYEEALTLANTIGDTNIIAIIEAAIESLK